jgi:hypothetical protein
VTVLSNDLEAVNIPGTWVTSLNTWRDVALFVGAVCNFAQVYQGITGGSVWFTGGVTLNSTFGSLPLAARNGIVTAAQNEGFDTSGFTGSSTLRQIIQSAGQQYIAAAKPMYPAGISLYTG